MKNLMMHSDVAESCSAVELQQYDECTTTLEYLTGNDVFSAVEGAKREHRQTSPLCEKYVHDGRGALLLVFDAGCGRSDICGAVISRYVTRVTS